MGMLEHMLLQIACEYHYLCRDQFCLETGRGRIPKINLNIYCVQTIIIVKKHCVYIQKTTMRTTTTHLCHNVTVKPFKNFSLNNKQQLLTKAHCENVSVIFLATQWLANIMHSAIVSCISIC